MSDLISRQDAIDALKRAEALTRAFGYHNVIETVRDLPSAQPERKNVRGEWEEVAERGLSDLRRCSNCGHIEPVGLEMITPKPNFCPNCGADMRGEEDE